MAPSSPSSRTTFHTVTPPRLPPHSPPSQATRPPRPPLHQYETLEDLLKEAGYKETRIAPENERECGPSSSTSGTMGGTVVKLLSTWMTRHVDPEREAEADPSLHRASLPRRRTNPSSPSWVTSLFTTSPSRAPSTTSERTATPSPAPRILSDHPRAARSHVGVTITNVVCRPAPVRKGSAASGSSSSSSGSRERRGSKSSTRRASVNGKKGKGVPMLVCESVPRQYSSDNGAYDDEESDDDELDLSRILIPSKRQHSIRSLRTVLLQNPHCRPNSPSPPALTPSSSSSSFSPTHRRMASLTSIPARPRPHSNSAPPHPYPYLSSHPAYHSSYQSQSSLPERMGRTSEPERDEVDMYIGGDGGEEGHWDSGEFMSAKVRRQRSRRPGWSSWGR